MTVYKKRFSSFLPLLRSPASDADPFSSLEKLAAANNRSTGAIRLMLSNFLFSNQNSVIPLLCSFADNLRSFDLIST